MSKLRSSWRLFKVSVAVIRRQPKSLVFPVLTSVFTFVIVACFALSFLAENGAEVTRSDTWTKAFDAVLSSVERGNGLHFSVAFYLYVVGFYFLAMFCATFFNVAFLHEILESLRGGSVSVARGLRFSVSRLRSILLWTLCAGLIGLAIKVIESRLDLVGRMMASVLGLAWSVASVFAVPALVLGDKGASPVDLVKRSASALKRTWGDALMGYIGFELGGGVIGLASLGLFAAAGAASFALGSFVVLGAVGVLWIVCIVALAYLTNAAGHVYKAALYLYASEGTVTASYDRDMFAEAWRMRTTIGTAPSSESMRGPYDHGV